MKSFQKFHNYDRKGLGCQPFDSLRGDPDGRLFTRPKKKDLAVEWLNTKIPFESGRNWQKRLLDKASFALNLEQKALKINIKNLVLRFKENSKKVRKSDE